MNRICGGQDWIPDIRLKNFNSDALKKIYKRVGRKLDKKKFLSLNLKVSYSNITFYRKISGQNVKLDTEYDI